MGYFRAHFGKTRRLRGTHHSNFKSGKIPFLPNIKGTHNFPNSIRPHSLYSGGPRGKPHPIKAPLFPKGVFFPRGKPKSGGAVTPKKKRREGAHPPQLWGRRKTGGGPTTYYERGSFKHGRGGLPTTRKRAEFFPPPKNKPPEGAPPVRPL